MLLIIINSENSSKYMPVPLKFWIIESSNNIVEKLISNIDPWIELLKLFKITLVKLQFLYKNYDKVQHIEPDWNE